MTASEAQRRLRDVLARLDVIVAELDTVAVDHAAVTITHDDRPFRVSTLRDALVKILARDRRS